MSIFLKLFLPFISGILFIGIVSVGGLFYVQKSSFDHLLEEKLSIAEDIYYNSIEKEAKNISGLVNLLESDSKLYEYYKSRDIDKVSQYTQEIYKRFNKSFDITHLYIIDSDKIVFHRAHMPERRGDIVDRITLLRAKETQEPSYGIEFGLFKQFTLRVVHPWIVDEKLIGYLEVGKEIDHLSTTISKYIKSDLFFVIDKNFIESKFTEEEILATKWIKINDGYVVSEVEGRLPEHIEQFLSNIKTSEGSSTQLYKNHNTGYIDLIDASCQKIGHIIISSDISQRKNETIYISITYALIIASIIAVLLITHYKYSRHVQSQLNYSNKKLEDAKIKAEEALRIKTEFLANMSHEIRTPMNSIIGMSHIVLKSKLQNTQKNQIKMIDNSAKSLLCIINDILDLSNIEAQKLFLEKTNFDMHKVIDDVFSLMEYKVQEKDLKLKMHYGNDVRRYFNGDSLRISQILTNLVGNAVKFTNFGEIEIYLTKVNENRFRFEIKDSGIGLTKEQEDKLFHSFSQADGSTTRKYGGTGLGLTISKKLVELMDGKIWVESKKDVGSSFIFEIELQQHDETDSIVIEQNSEEEDHSEEERLEKSMLNLRGKKVLLVEDNKTNQLVICGLLEDSGIEIDIANNGQEAVDKFKENRYALILMDLQMPVMDGYQATKIIREIDKDIPIIALTANIMREDIEKTQIAGMSLHLGKPINVQKLYSTLIKYIS